MKRPKPPTMPDGQHRRPKPRFTYVEAMQAAQAGVKAEQALNNDPPEKMFKDLRVGINSNLCNQAAIVKLLVEKGIITHEEYMDAITQEMNDEVKRYEESLSKRTGQEVTLTPPPKFNG